jgi:4-amino-4-deoxy-L-arabinose transferase-like glycosyltransferase
VSKPKPKVTAQQAIPANNNSQAFAEKWEGNPVKNPVIWLVLACILVYFSTFQYGFTELDDTIFINEFKAYNEDLGNLITSFQRGLFDAVKDPYYRPLFMDSIILNYQLSDGGTNIVSFHVVNVLLHIFSVLLLYRLFMKLQVRQLHALILALVFAVHPVLSQAVAWIPGRNDTLLAIFVFSFLLYVISYSNTGKIQSLVLSVVMLMLAYFTKETAVFAAPVAFVLLVMVLGKDWRDKRNITQYVAWAGCFALWYAIRSAATVQTNDITPAQMASDFVRRLPVVVQYIGKIFLPFNLSVFPTQEDTTYYLGIAAIVILGVAIFLSKEKNVKALAGGFIVFILFLLPALIVPSSLNQQTFEHRLYLPIIGILLMLPHTVFFQNKLRDRQLFFAAIAVVSVFVVVNLRHQKSFSDPFTFWSRAAKKSPNSAYANMMLAARVKDNPERSYALFRKAYSINPKEKYLNFYMGEMMQKKDSVLASEKYLLEEKKISDYYQCDFYLARVAMEKKDFEGAINYLRNYLKRDPGSTMANNNLLLLYMQQQQFDNAKAQVKNMRELGMPVPQSFVQQLGM